MTSPARYRVFISSTSLDLGGLRQQVLRFLRVLPAELVAMEDFGSDEARPKDLCLAKVAQCNVFIGIYAQRYGHIDPESGQSITELEYRRAAAMLADGTMRILLLYLIDPDALWPIRFNDTDPVSLGRLQQLKEEIKGAHTVSTFKQADDLPFLILRDLIGKMDIGRQVLLPRARASRPRLTRLLRPIGMDMFGPEHAGLFRGREQDREALVRQVTSEPVSLLLGASGVGKSSLIQAGLLTELERLGWLVVLLRPFENLRASLAHQVWTQAIQGVAERDLSLREVIQLCRQAHPDRMILLVFDQFEDVMLPALKGEIPALLSDLYPLHGGADGRLRMLFSYRSDAEGDMGPLWQRLSRSTGTYARMYLGPLGPAEAAEAMRTLIRATARSGEVDGDETAAVVRDMVKEVATESERNGFDGVYPPYLQIVLNEVVARADQRECSLRAAYQDLGGTHKIVQDFLIGQLRHFGAQLSDARRVLVALVRSHGTKSQRSAEHIADEVQLDAAQLSSILQRLMDLRLVRQVESGYEVAHDFLARRIIAETVTSEEMTRKRSRELLESKVSAYSETHALLSLSEYLFLYRRRESLRAGIEQIVYLVRSAVPLAAPACFWLSALDPTQVAEVLGEVGMYPGSLRQRSWTDAPTRERAPVTLDGLLRAVESPLRHEREDAISRLSRVPDIGRELNSLAGRSSARARYAAARLRMLRAADRDPGWCLKNLSAKAVSTRCDAAAGLAHHPDASHLELLRTAAGDPKASTRIQYACGYAAGCIAATLDRQAELLSLRVSEGQHFIAGAVAGIGATGRELPKDILTTLPSSWSEDVLLALANLMGRGMQDPWLLLNDDEIQGALYSNELLAAIAETGEGDQVLRYVELLRECEHPANVQFDPQPIALAAATLQADHRARIRELMAYEAFGLDADDTVPELVDLPEADASTLGDSGLDAGEPEPDLDCVDDALPGNAPPWIAYDGNAYYLRWLVGCLFAVSAGRDDAEVLYKLARHKYWHIRSSALEKLAGFLEIQDMPRVIEELESLRDADPDITAGLLDLARRIDASAYPFPEPAAGAGLPSRPGAGGRRWGSSAFDDMDDDIPF